VTSVVPEITVWMIVPEIITVVSKEDVVIPE
jgi:hypothetical protein